MCKLPLCQPHSQSAAPVEFYYIQQQIAERSHSDGKRILDQGME